MIFLPFQTRTNGTRHAPLHNDCCRCAVSAASGEMLSGRSCYSWQLHAGREWIEGRGMRAEVQSARAYTDRQHLTTENASSSERIITIYDAGRTANRIKHHIHPLDKSLKSKSTYQVDSDCPSPGINLTLLA